MLGESQRFVVLVLLVVGVSDGARPVEPRSAAHHFELAREYSSEYDEKSDELALKHFRTAAELGHPGAFYELGVRHLHGWGVPESPFLAHVMLSVAVVEYDRIRSVAETDRAVARRDRIDSSLTDEQRQESQGFSKEWQAICHRDVGSQPDCPEGGRWSFWGTPLGVLELSNGEQQPSPPK